MTLKDFNEINWHRGNVAKLNNGKEYLVKGTKGHGKYLLLYSDEYDKYFMADYKIVECRISDYEEPEEVYQEKKRQKQAEAQAKRDAERQALINAKEERKQKNLQEQELIRQEALAKKAAKHENQSVEKNSGKQQQTTVTPKPVEKTDSVAEESVPDQPKRKRKRITVSRTEKVQIKY